VGAEYLDLKKRLKDIQFMEYWALLGEKLKEKGGKELTQKIPMEKLNKARVDFKHYGNPPSKYAIQDFRDNVISFFEENTPIVFGVEFSDISLIELVECQTTKSSLKDAQRNLKDNKLEDSLDKVAISFAQLIDDYENTKKDQFGRSPFFFGGDMTFLDSLSLDIPSTSRLAEFVDTVKESIGAMQDSVKILSLGLDYRKYARFRLLTPDILRIPAGSRKTRYKVQRFRREVEVLPEDVEFCINFVIESAIALREFDFEARLRTHPTLTDFR